jgi:uncharacterized glyoxalase superfamily protein PhnB
MRAHPTIESLVPVLQVNNVSAALAYYRDALGFSVDFAWREPPTYAGLTLGHVCLHLAKGEPRSASVVAFFCTGLDTLFQQFNTNGARIERPISVEPYGMREFAVTDFDGHRLIFGESTHTEAKD